HIGEFQLESCIHTRLSDGVQSLQPGEADSVLIAGMGGALTVKILSEGEDVLRTVKEIILQPQSEIEKVRHYLEQTGYDITKEDMVFEDGKYYPVMKAESGEMHYDREIFYMYGKLLLDEKHPVLKQYLEDRMNICRKILEKLDCEAQQEERMKNRIREIKAEMEYIREAYLYMGYETNTSV
ncbi:MAG: SAM-dependent methyltransferase, partial [Clostridia bacterium]|nr:SAM-dependent methyltransferase [Clostridia bacterium]